MNNKRMTDRQIGLAIRGLGRVEAASYIGVSPSLFDQMVKDGRMPSPKRINSRTIWDRFSLDGAGRLLALHRGLEARSHDVRLRCHGDAGPGIGRIRPR